MRLWTDQTPRPWTLFLRKYQTPMIQDTDILGALFHKAYLKSILILISSKYIANIGYIHAQQAASDWLCRLPSCAPKHSPFLYLHAQPVSQLAFLHLHRCVVWPGTTRDTATTGTVILSKASRVCSALLPASRMLSLLHQSDQQAYAVMYVHKTIGCRHICRCTQVIPYGHVSE
jgi:hypothetical protein